MSNEIKAFAVELRELLTKYNVSLAVNIEGDTHGMTTDFVVTEKNGYGDDHMLNQYYASVDASDLKDF